jgi:hypothetical protein
MLKSITKMLEDNTGKEKSSQMQPRGLLGIMKKTLEMNIVNQ